MHTIHTCAAQVSIFYSIAAVALAAWLVEKKRCGRQWLWFWISSAAGVPVLMFVIWGDQYGIQMPIPVEKLLINYSLLYIFMLILCLLPFGGTSIILLSLFNQRKPKALAEAYVERNVFNLVFWLSLAASALSWIALLVVPQVLP